ncbi:hypothetical protein [Micromonospora sp. NPDC050276]|uniref:hypothetical protein n=1 Tax=Micromonospora sp. NPDC050276 TaxID=3364278 RepID=UPI00379F72D9
MPDSTGSADPAVVAGAELDDGGVTGDAEAETEAETEADAEGDPDATGSALGSDWQATNAPPHTSSAAPVAHVVLYMPHSSPAAPRLSAGQSH